MIRPFRLENLKRISREEIGIIKAMCELLPANEARTRIKEGVLDTIAGHIGGEVSIKLVSAERFLAEDFVSKLPEASVIGVIGMSAPSWKLLFTIDYEISSLLIDRLLGGTEKTSPSDTRRFTDVELGILQYLVMQVLKKIYDMCDTKPRLHFRFERFISEPHGVLTYAEAKGDLYVATFEVRILDNSGIFNIIIPSGSVSEFIKIQKGAGDITRERNYFKNELERFGFLNVPVWAEAGRSMINPVDLEGLEAGDIILFDESMLNLSGGILSGSVTIHFGDSEEGVTAKLEGLDKEKARFRLDVVE